MTAGPITSSSRRLLRVPAPGGPGARRAAAGAAGERRPPPRRGARAGARSPGDMRAVPGPALPHAARQRRRSRAPRAPFLSHSRPPDGGALERAADAAARGRPVDSRRRGPAGAYRGAAGYVGYDWGMMLERVPRARYDDLLVPDVQLALYDWVIAWDHPAGRAWIISTGIPQRGAARERRAASRLAFVQARLATSRVE